VAAVDEQHGASVRRRGGDFGPNGTCTRPRLMEGVWAVVGRDGPNVAVAADAR